MTLVIALANADQVIQVSDRQLTDAQGRPCVLPENKATILTLADARLICGFAGLARAGRFRTGQWILNALLEAAADDHLAHRTVERFTASATSRFAQPDIAEAVSREHRGLSILLTGYRDHVEGPRLIAALVTNFQNFETGRDEPPWDKFRATYWSMRECEPNPTYIQRIGHWPAMMSADEQRLRAALEARMSQQTLVNLGVGLVREIAARPSARGTIGAELSSAVLPPLRPPELARGEIPVVGGLHPVGAAHVWRGVNQVVSISGLELALMDPQFGPVERTPETATLVQKVGRNKLCPCGSGKKYKKCHGACPGSPAWVVTASEERSGGGAYRGGRDERRVAPARDAKRELAFSRTPRRRFCVRVDAAPNGAG
jgi:hypothetical protein